MEITQMAKRAMGGEIMIGIYKIDGFKKELVASLPGTLHTLEDIKQYILFEDEGTYDRIQMDEYYYLISEFPWEIIGVMSLHKGWGFFDIAEHEDRARIKNVFPDKDLSYN